MAAKSIAQEPSPSLLNEANPEPVGGFQELVVAEPDSTVLLFERLARDPNVDPDKLERLISLQERIMRHNAKAAFDAAFAKMAPQIPEIDEKGNILNRDGTVRSRYAKLEDIHKAIKPICSAHGFAIRHRTEWPADKPNIIRVVGILSHEQGHSEESVFEAPADVSDYRTDIQSQGSTVSYGRRYTTLDLLNIATRGADNDGQGGKPAPPDGFDKVWAQMEAASKKGFIELEAIWENLDSKLKNFIVKHYKHEWETMKKSAPRTR